MSIYARGAYTGPTLQRLKEWYPEAIFHDDMEAEGWVYPGDETAETGNRRAEQVYADLKHRFAGKRVALFAHGGFNRHLLLVALGLSYDSKVYFQQNNGCIYWLSVAPERTIVNYLGDTRILEDEGVRYS